MTTFCVNQECHLRAKCKRASAPTSGEDYWQAYFSPDPKTDECDYFIKYWGGSSVEQDSTELRKQIHNAWSDKSMG